MDPHFRAFSFVDRIALVEPGGRVRGCYAIPSGIDTFPLSLAAEAVGQLAAWGAMAALDFTQRPLAGIASEVELLGPIRPGQQLDLAADLESVDADAVVYSGAGYIDGVPVIRLTDCVGPMVPLGEYDEPQAVRGRFELICNSGAQPGGFGGLPPLALELTAGECGRSLRMRLGVPEAAPFFADHFPRRALFPGTLLLQASLELAHRLVAELPESSLGGPWAIQKIEGVKLRTFIPPGAVLHLEAKVAEPAGPTLHLDVETRNGRRTISSARVVFRCQGNP